MDRDQPVQKWATSDEHVAVDPAAIREVVRDQYLKALDESQYALFKAREWAGSNRLVSEQSLHEINQMQERLTELMHEGRGEPSPSPSIVSANQHSGGIGRG